MNKNFIVDNIFNEINYLRKNEEIVKAIEEARLEMNVARAAFEYVNDPKLIEAVIYGEQAARARYEYLILQARKKGITVDYSYILAKNCSIE